MTLRQLGRRDEARAVLEEQTRRTPDSPVPYLALLSDYVGEGSVDQARAMIQEVLARTQPDEYLVKFELGSRAFGLPGGRQMAEDLLREAERHPGYHIVTSRVLLGVLLEGRNEEESRRYLDLARHEWVSPMDFAEFIAAARRQLAGDVHQPATDSTK
jgi:hypothetical protein